MDIERAEITSAGTLGLFAEHDDFMIDFLGEDSGFYTRYAAHEPLEAVWIVCENGEASGCAAFRRKDDATGEVKRVFVRPEYRGRGLAKLLMASVEAHAREQGCEKLFLDTRITLEPAVALYRKLGFEIVFRQGLYVQMEKKL